MWQDDEIYMAYIRGEATVGGIEGIFLVSMTAKPSMGGFIIASIPFAKLGSMMSSHERRLVHVCWMIAKLLA